MIKVSIALTANGFKHTSLCGANAEQRKDAIIQFTRDPSCIVLNCLLSNSSGAAGTCFDENHYNVWMMLYRSDNVNF